MGYSLHCIPGNHPFNESQPGKQSVTITDPRYPVSAQQPMIMYACSGHRDLLNSNSADWRTGMGTNGIDLSIWQHGTDITKMPGLDFVLAKASQGYASGGGFEDTTYGTWAEQAQAAGVHFGAYHYLRTDLPNMRAQADYFCSVARPRPGLSLWIDYEVYGSSPQADAEYIGYFACEVKRNTGNKAKIGIYCNDDGLSRIKPYLAEIPYNGFWNADPSRGMTVQNPDMSWNVHQYEVVNNIDRNYSAWSRAEWESYWAW